MAALIHATLMILVRSLVLERWHCHVKRLAPKPRQLRDGSSMMMTPKVTQEYGTVFVDFAMISKAYEIEVIVRRALNFTGLRNPTLASAQTSTAAGPAPGFRLQ